MNEPQTEQITNELGEQFDRLMKHKQEAQEFFSFRLTAPRIFLMLLAQERAINRDEPKIALFKIQDSEYYERVRRLRYGSVAYRRMYTLCERDIFYRRMHDHRVFFRPYSRVRRSLQSVLATIPTKVTQ